VHPATVQARQGGAGAGGVRGVLGGLSSALPYGLGGAGVGGGSLDPGLVANPFLDFNACKVSSLPMGEHGP
jgi:hypothetical protein